MATTPCHECGEFVSEAAFVCPKCGVTRLEQLPKVSFFEMFGPWILGFVVVFVLLLILF